jgi:hypothetical protein
MIPGVIYGHTGPHLLKVFPGQTDSLARYR